VTEVFHTSVASVDLRNCGCTVEHLLIIRPFGYLLPLSHLEERSPYFQTKC